MILGGLVIAFAAHVFRESINKAEAVSSALIGVAGIFLALIGLFPSGTRPHVFVSTYFFAQMDIAILFWGLSILARGLKIYACAAITIALTGPLGTVTIPWPSVALQEIYGIILINIFAVIATIIYWPRERPEDPDSMQGPRDLGRSKRCEELHLPIWRTPGRGPLDQG
jgi:hypothetical membrane protein